jgi:hypothetical protein
MASAGTMSSRRRFSSARGEEVGGRRELSGGGVTPGTRERLGFDAFGGKKQSTHAGLVLLYGGR